ncbi:MAG: sialidase family protein [Candidatus Latescibacterota bacterium]
MSAWKWDVVIYDRPGWNSFTYNYPIEGMIRQRGDEIMIRFDSADESRINDDFYYEHYRQIVLSSKDGGLTWEEIEPDWAYYVPLKLSDGTLVEVVAARQMVSREEQKARLEELGIGSIWREDCLLRWDMWPECMAAELQGKGLTIWDKKVREGSDWRYLPDGVVATHASSDLITRRSADGGLTWKEDRIPDVESFSHFVTCFAGSVVLPDDTILIPCYGVKKKQEGASEFFESLLGSGLFILRSEDRGETYRFIEIPGENSMDRNLDEVSLVSHPSGRVVALFRSDAAGCHIHQSISEDGGKSWGVPQRTGMQGLPLNALCLKSGRMLCAYARRWHPAGMRATLSYDGGETWDVASEKVLRDDALPACFLGGPGVIQLDDESIFAFYSLPKLVTLKKDDLVDQEKMIMDRNFHQYIAGSRFTEEYLGPLGR